MDILPYLAERLKTQKEVSLNGFGTFFKTKVPGRYDEQTQSYLPPFYTLNFKQEANADHQLATYISENRRLSLNTASYFVDEYVTGLNQTLAENAEINLPGLGKLKQGEPALIFEADPEADLGHDFFGLPPIKAASIVVTEAPAKEVFQEIETSEIEHIEEESPEQSFEEITPPVETEPQYAPDDEASTDTPDIPVTNESENKTLVFENQVENTPAYIETEEEPEAKPAYIKWLIIIFILGALIAVLLMLKPAIYKDIFKNKADTTTTAFDKEQLKNKADTVNTDTALRNKIKDVLTDSLNTVEQEKKVDAVTYEIIVTAESSEARIKKMIANYNKMGFQAKVIPAMPGKLMQKISVATFENQKEALDSLKVVKKKLKSDDPYVFTNLNK